MKKNQPVQIGIKVFVALTMLSLFVVVLVQPKPSFAQVTDKSTDSPADNPTDSPTDKPAPTPPTERGATLKVKSNPAGVNMLASTCFTTSSGTCGTTNWTSTNPGNIPHTSYQYPTTAIIGGISYTLDSSSLTGCNQGTSGSPIDVCEVSVAAGATETISATYKVTPSPGRIATLNVQSNPSGISLANPSCFTTSSGTCGITNWTSTNPGNIPTTSYQYPTTATINGTNYTLDSSSLTGCNQGTSGSPIDVCEVSVAAGATETISATYTLVIPPPATSSTLNIQSIPAGVINVVPYYHGTYPVTAGTLGTTNWTMVNVGGSISTDTYRYPQYTSIGGVSYTLNPNSLIGCNQGTSGSIPDMCSVSVAAGATETISATYSITPPLPTCPASAANLVQNPGFETVHPNQPMFIYTGSYAILDPTGPPFTEVQDWTRIGIDPGLVPRVTDNPGGYGILLQPFEGLKEALLESHSYGGAGYQFLGYHPDGIVGTLSTPTTAGSTYLISAEISTEFVMHAPSFEMWLRNSATGADSAHIVQVVLPQQAMHWTRFAGAITANGQYDRVVISYNQGQADYMNGNGARWAQVDDVHACKVGTTLPWWKTWSALGLALMLLSAIGGLIMWQLRKKKHDHTGIVTLVK